MGYLVSFWAFFPFRPKMIFHFCFIFRFRYKNVICVAPKMLCSQLNRNYGTGDFRFRFSVEKGNCIFVGIFVYGRKWKMNGRPLHQTVSDYTLRFQTFNNPGSGQPVPWKISFTLHRGGRMAQSKSLGYQVIRKRYTATVTGSVGQ